jgi:outer membrane protein assembly factor BamA
MNHGITSEIKRDELSESMQVEWTRLIVQLSQGTAKLLVLFILLIASNPHTSAQNIILHFQNGINLSEEVKHKVRRSERRRYNSADDAAIATVNIVASLHRSGYLLASVDSSLFNDDTLQVWLYSGPKILASVIRFPDEDRFLTSVAFQGATKRNKAVRLPDKELEKFTSNFHRQGYPLAGIEVKEMFIRHDSLITIADILPGPFYVWDSLWIKGDLSINNIVLQKHLRIKAGEPYSNQLLSRMERNLRGLHYLKLTSPPGIILTESGKARVVIQAEKRNASSFNGVIGFGPDRANPGKLLFSGDMQLRLLNAFEQGEQMEVKWIGVSGDQLLVLGYAHPYLPLLPFGGVFNFDLYKHGDLYYTMNQRFGVLIRTGADGWITTYLQRKNSKVLDRSVFASHNTLPPWTDFSTTLFGLEYKFQNIDYVQNPSRGVVFSGDLAAGRKTLLQASDIPEAMFTGIETTQRQFRGEIILENFIPVTPRWILRPMITAYRLNSSVNNENELVRFGGTNSIRGFEERSLSASSMLLGSIELRYRFEQGSHFKIYADGGWYEKKLLSSYSRDLPFGFGIGVALPSPAGILQVNYAWGIQHGNPFELRNGRLHFGLTSTF